MHDNTEADWHEALENQANVVGRPQVLRAGISRNVVRRRLGAGRWQRLHRGVYATFSGPRPREAQLWAALLRAGPGATLSHYTAAELHGLIDSPADQIHVTVPATRNPARQRKITGLVIHRSCRVEAARHPVLSPPRTRVEDTVLDLVEAAHDFDEAFTWISRAVGRRRTTAPLLATAAAARKRMRWRTELAAALTDVADGVHSLLERRYVTGAERAHGLPRAARQVRRGHGADGTRSTYIDNLYVEYDACVEVDGSVAHPADQRWRDIRRDNVNTASGSATLRFGWTDITQHPCQVAMLVADTLRRRGWQGTPHPCSPTCPAARS
jgi:predicted transcriptional regulator of viral defense system